MPIACGVHTIAELTSRIAGKAAIGKVAHDWRKDEEIAAMFQALLVGVGDGLKGVAKAADRAAFRTGRSGCTQKVKAVALEINRHFGRDAEERAGVHVIAASDIGLDLDNTAAKAV